VSYDHGRKAGNSGDVWKHFILVSAVQSAREGSQNFRYLDSHAGAPVHGLLPKGEWAGGIGRVLETCRGLQDHPYFAMAGEFVRKQSYPAGWWFVADRLSARCRNVDVLLADTDKSVLAKYREGAVPVPAQNVTVRFEKTDGFKKISDTNADLTFIDPPFHPNAAVDWDALGDACRLLKDRGSAFLAWYPIYWPTRPHSLVSLTGCRSWEVMWAEFGAKPSQNLKGCGMLASVQLTSCVKRTELETLASCLGGRFFVRLPKST
jgi:23S rRNA A2030 N6-methylase RlmJ